MRRLKKSGVSTSLRKLAIASVLLAAGSSSFSTPPTSAIPPIPDQSGTIRTVLGAINPSELGVTLPHEHIFIDFTLPLDEPERWRLAFRQLPKTASELEIWNMPFTELSQRELMLENLWRNRDNLLLQDPETSLSELMEFQKLGGTAVVDVTSVGIGRNPQMLADIAERSGLHIVMGTGWYLSAWHPDEMNELSVDELTASIVKDLVEGVGDTEIRAGIIGEVSAMYISTSPEYSAEARALRAAARASRLTGAALSLHQWIRDGEMLELTLRILEEEGADLSRVILGHIDAISARDTAHLEALMDRGLTLEFDLFGTPYLLHHPALDDRPMADAIVALVQSGYGDRLLMSHDVCTKLQQRAYGGKGFGYIQKQVVPYLLEQGLSDADIRQIQVENPARLLSFAAPVLEPASSPRSLPRYRTDHLPRGR